MDYEFLLLEFQQPSGADGKLVLVGRPKSPEAASARDRALFHKPLSLPVLSTLQGPDERFAREVPGEERRVGDRI